MDRPLKPGECIDDLECDALHTEDVEDLMRRVAVLEAKRAAEQAIVDLRYRASLN
jgi:hypothetical protein